MRVTHVNWCWTHRDTAPPNTDTCWTKTRRDIIPGFADDRQCMITMATITEEV